MAYTKTTVANGETKLIAAANSDRVWLMVYHETAGATIHLGLDGDSAVTAFAGTKPGVPLPAGAAGAYEDFVRHPNFRRVHKAVYCHNASGVSVVVVVQED